MSYDPRNEATLCKVDFDGTYSNVIKFQNESSRNNYFSSLPNFTITNNDYILDKQNFRLSSSLSLEELRKYNYLIASNREDSTRKIFYFIEEWERKTSGGSGESKVYFCKLKVDVWQTLHLTVDFNNLTAEYVERMHTWDDKIGMNVEAEPTIAELNYNYKLINIPLLNQHLFTVMCANLRIQFRPTEVYKNNLDTIQYYDFGGWEDGTGKDQLREIMEIVNEKGLTSEIVEIYKCPYQALPESSGEPEEPPLGTTVRRNITGDKPREKYFTIAKPTINTDISNYNYTPKNKKLLQSPFYNIVISNNDGQKTEYSYELFENNECKFLVVGNYEVDPILTISPINYITLSQEYKFENMIVLSNFSKSFVTVDTFKNWLAQNGVSTAITALTSIIAMGVSGATGNVPGFVGGAIGLGSTINNVATQSKEPNQIRGRITSNFLENQEMKKFSCYIKSLSYESALIMDNYFSKYGYSWNRFLVPNITSRKRFNYIKIKDCGIKCNCTNTELIEFRNIFNNGVTIWHDVNTFLDWGLDNPIII